ncbi:MAG: NAD-dependent epimerase/dehydratase family protein [Gemmatimonadetes bacterium]|nr:NAD-dependent epimerase/dehydratase family protein [Gemmatimonadota bacterium]
MNPAERFLVTGATGFVGTHLVQALCAAGASVRALVRPTSEVARLAELGVELVPGALEDGAALARAVEGADVVLHLAATTRARNAQGYWRANAEGTRALVQAVLKAARPPRRLVYLSSLAAAGPARNGAPIERQDAPRPVSAYGRSKLEGEFACLAAAGEREVVVLRAPVVYGPRDRDLLLFFRLAARGVLPVPAGPERTLQLVHVTDLTAALILAATTAAAAGIYHAADPRPYAWPDVARLMGQAVGRRARTMLLPAALFRAAGAASELASAIRGRPSIFNRDKVRELLAPAWLCETAAARRELRFEAAISLPEGLAATAAWYRAHGWL